jgi:hypothetical protein
MAKKKSANRGRTPKTVLQLPDLDQAKSAVLNSLSSTDAQREYRARDRRARARLHPTTERYLGCKQRIRSAVNDRIGIEPGD